MLGNPACQLDMLDDGVKTAVPTFLEPLRYILLGSCPLIYAKDRMVINFRDGRKA